MAQLDLPDSMDSISSDAIIYQDQNAKIIVEALDDDLAVNMYVVSHDDFEDIVPDDVINCVKYSSPSGEPSSVVDLPDTYTSIFKSAVSACKKQYGLQKEFTREPIGVCTSCLPNAGSGKLVFTEHLTPK